jgi:hypothetical protein
MAQDPLVRPDTENVTPDTQKTETASGAGARKAWSVPVISELEISRTSNNPSTGSDGGTGDCQHL